MTIVEVYEKYKHLDEYLSDEEWLREGEGAPVGTLYDLWQAVKEAATGPNAEVERLRRGIEAIRDFTRDWGCDGIHKACDDLLREETT